MGTMGYMSPEQLRGLAGRPPLRHLLLRRDPVRAALGPEGVQAGHGERHDRGDPEGGAAGADAVGAEHLAGAGPHRAALPGEGPGEPVPDGQGRRVRALGGVELDDDAHERRAGGRRAGDEEPRATPLIAAARRRRARGRGDSSSGSARRRTAARAAGRQARRRAAVREPGRVRRTTTSRTASPTRSAAS